LALAAERLGRQWVLIESVPEYAEIAHRRLQEKHA
jgi:DNA modification methylase